MWREMARIIHEVRPKYVFVENSPMLTSRGLGTVLGDLAKMGSDAKWGVLGANAVGAPHQRERIWICGSHPSSERWNDRISHWKERQLLRDKNWDASKSKSEREGWFSWIGQIGANVADSNSSQRERMCGSERIQQKNSYIGNPCWWEIEPDVGRMADGVAAHVDRLKAIGNGQVPLCAATAWRLLNDI